MLKETFTKVSLLTLTAVALLTQGFIGCSSDDDDEGITDPGSLEFVGVFLDSEVEGLTYQSGGNPPGVTDQNGTFVYTPGQPISFSVGGVQLGSLDDGDAVCTPNDFMVPENIARFLQSLDADNDPSNGIDLTAASSLLNGQIVSSDVFENTSATGFETDQAIVDAMAAAGTTLLDTSTTNANLRDGTDSSFDPAELAGHTFMIADPLEAGYGFIIFDELLNANDMGSTGSLLTFDETTSEGGSGSAEDFVWNISNTGIMSLTLSGQDVLTVTRAGSSTRSISVSIVDIDAPTRALTLLKIQSLTETDLCGAPITQGGTSSRTYSITSPGDSEQITLKSDGTISAVGSTDGPWSGTWSVGDVSPNTLKIVDNSFPTDWSFVVLAEGSLADGGSLIVGDVVFDQDYIWESLFVVSITPLP